MSRTIIVAGCLGESARSIRHHRRHRRDPVLLDRPHRAILDASDADAAGAWKDDGSMGLPRGSAAVDPISRRCLASILSAGCCSSNSKRCDSDSAGCRRCRLFSFLPFISSLSSSCMRVAVRGKQRAQSLSRELNIREANSFGDLGPR